MSSSELRFSPDFTAFSQDIVVFEMDEEFMGAFKAGEELWVQGEDRDAACVVCTSARTYSAKMVDTSNFLGFLSGDELRCGAKGFIELRPVRADFSLLWRRLSAAPLCAAERAVPGDAAALAALSAASLTEAVPASAGELRAVLRALGAIEFEGHWRLLEREYLWSSLKTICSILRSREWPPARVPRADFESEVREDDPQQAAAVVALVDGGAFGRHVGDDDDTLELDRRRFSREAARHLLPQGKSMIQDQFLREWAAAVRALIEDWGVERDDAADAVVTCDGFAHGVDADALSYVPKERVRQLFDVVPRWTERGIVPFLEPLGDAKATLLRFCRPVGTGEQRYFVKKNL